MSGAGVVALVAGLVTAAGPDLESVARSTAEQNGKAVVTIRLVLKLKLQGQEHEQKLEVPGVVIDPSGVARRMMEAQRQRGSIESELKEAVLLLEDGTELDAAVVLKDTDLDLAFVRPRDTGLKLSAVSLKPRPGTVPVLTRVFVLGRLSKLANRALAVATGEVRAYVRGPAPYYVTDGETSVFFGSLVYTADGVPLGLLVRRFATSFDSSAGGRSDTVMTVVRPVEKVLELAAQAKNIQPAAPAPESSPAN